MLTYMCYTKVCAGIYLHAEPLKSGAAIEPSLDIQVVQLRADYARAGAYFVLKVIV